MNRFVAAAVLGVGIVVCGYPPSLLAQQSAQAPAPRVRACSLLPKAEVRKHIPWHDIVDSMEPEEEPVFTDGSACEYPSVRIQVWPAAGRSRPNGSEYETISGVGEAAYFRSNRDRYAELYVSTGKYVVTLQASVPRGGTIESVKPRVVDLAKALIAKLP